MLQQLEYQFGQDRVRQIRQEARHYIGNCFKKGWLLDYSVVATGEGGLSSMINHATALALYAQNPILGLQEYGQYLDHEYGRTKYLNREEILASLPSDFFEYSYRWKEIEGEEAAFASLGDAFAPLEGEPSIKKERLPTLSPLQRDALVTWCHTGSIAEVAEYLGIEYKTAENAVGIARRKLRSALTP